MKQTIEQRVKALEKKVLVLEGGNLFKEDSENSTGNKKMVTRPNLP